MLALPGLSVNQYLYCSSVKASPPPPVPSMTPKARRSSRVKSDG